MNTVVVGNVLGSLERELDVVSQQILQLTTYRHALQKTIELHKQARRLAPAPIGRPRVETPTSVSEETAMSTDAQPESTAPSTLEMARTVLKNAGTPLSLNEIRRAIKQTYGLEPAKSVDQMLYKRAQAGRGFFKNEAGLFGLTEQRPAVVITPIDTPSTASV